MTKYDYIKTIEARLSDADKRRYAEIFAPVEVAVPDADAWRGLCVMPDGRIRFYGHHDKKSVFDNDCAHCYIESTDGGLSWKKHVLPEKTEMEAAAFVPFAKPGSQYISVIGVPGEGTVALIGKEPGDPGARRVKITDEVFHSPFIPQVLESRGRILVMTEREGTARQSNCIVPVVCYSDDLGESWTIVKLGEAPYHEITYPHKGYRWQQNNREITVEELSDGSLLMISRTSTDYHYMSRSFDGGASWTAFEPTAFHSTGTMPKLKRLSDGRLILTWCNTKLLPELAGADGFWEDVFTNRDANHIAISEDDGKSWIGMREMRLNPHRNAADFRSVGGPECDRDKSVHQFELLELPMGKLLVVSGQHYACRQISILDLNWIYETARHEDFLHGLHALSTHNYVKSWLGGHRGSPANPNAFAGHCAYYRTSVSLLVPCPVRSGKESLSIIRSGDPRLVSGIGGAVWNFPTAKKGRVTIKAHIGEKGLRVSLLDYFMNPSDESVQYFADYTVVLRADMHDKDEFYSDFVLDFDCEAGICRLTNGDYLDLTMRMNGAHPYGLSYLHMQSAATEVDYEGSLVAELDFKKI